MSHFRWLIDQLPGWEKAGLLPADAVEKLKAHALQQEKTGVETAGESKVAQVVMGVLGALFVGSGVLALIAHNWDHIPRQMRIAGSFALMASAQGLVAWVILKGDGLSRWVCEASALFLVLASGGCLALVSQIYNMGGDWPDFLFVWLLLAVPLLWALKAHSCALFHLVCITVWTVDRMDHWRLRPWQDSPWIYLILLSLTLVYWPGFARPRPALPNAVRWTAAVSALIGFCAIASYSLRRARGDGEMWLFMLTFANVAMLPLSRAGVDERTSRKPQVVLGTLGLLVTGFICSTGWGARNLGAHLKEAGATGWCWVLVVLLAVFAVTALVQRRWAVAAIGSISLLPLLSLATLQMGARPDLSWAFTIHLFLIGLVMILAEFFGAKGSPRFGALLVTILILVRMGDSELPLMTKAVVFIITGVAFIIFNVVWTRWKKGKGVVA